MTSPRFEEIGDAASQKKVPSEAKLMDKLLPSRNPDKRTRLEAMEALMEYVKDDLNRFLSSYYQNDEAVDREDIISDTLLTAHLEIEKGNYEPRKDVSIIGWIIGIAKNKCKMRFDDAQNYTSYGDIEDGIVQADEAPESSDYDEKVQANLKKALGKLTARRREILRLYFNEGLSAEEIAERLGIKSSLVRKDKERSLSRLKGLIELMSFVEK